MPVLRSMIKFAKHTFILMSEGHYLHPDLSDIFL